MATNTQPYENNGYGAPPPYSSYSHQSASLPFSPPIVPTAPPVEISRHEVKKQDSSFFENPQNRRIVCLITGLILGALAGLAAYFCITNGLPIIDHAHSSLQMFTGGALTYMGLAFTLASVGNILYSVVNSLLLDDCAYSHKHLRIQVGLSIFAPVAAIPLVVLLGLSIATPKRLL